MKKIILYVIFALIATIINIASQEFVFIFYSGPHVFYVALIIGTISGLVLKYMLDKRFIFDFHANDIAHDSKTFATYTLMGLITTVIFWCFEFIFDFLFQTKIMRYLGGAIGLAIGYITKYQLDKRYVFKSEL